MRLNPKERFNVMSEADTPTAESGTWHRLSIDEALARLGVDSRSGLSSGDARRRLRQHGPNRLAAKPPRPAWRVFVDQFRSLLILVLLLAAFLAAVIGDLKDGVVICAVVVLNALLGFYQEYRAEQSLHALKGMLALKAEVRRGGRRMRVPAERLVPGDIVLLDAGDKVPADGRLILAHRLELDESTLTGESQPVGKDVDVLSGEDVPLAEWSNRAFMNTSVTRGRGEMVVTATGMQTEMGRLAQMLAAEEQPTPLQRQLDALGKRLGAIAALVAMLIFITGVWRGEPLVQIVLTAIALAVAAIPEGLPAVVTVTLAIGMRRMAREHAIVKRLAAVETLGCATVICSDKTGTLTRNRMVARAVYFRMRRRTVPADDDASSMAGAAGAGAGAWADLRPLLVPLALCNDTRMQGGEAVGEPTEAALATLAARGGLRREALERRLPRIAELPFDPLHKFMATFHRSDGEIAVFVKGAPDVLLERCTRILGPRGEEGLNAVARQAVAVEATALAAEGLRVLAVAAARLEADSFDADGDLFAHVRDLSFAGLVGLADPPRPEAQEAIEQCKRAGIAVKMITGDHKVTAEAIARELGVGGTVVTGTELDSLDDASLLERIEQSGVFARVAPEHKLRIVRALRSRGHVVAVTGDGVNDAPALRHADIGVAMGRGGTDVTREAATMVLADDNFATIVGAVKEGRTIYDNIVKFVRFQLSTNIGAILSVAAAPLFGLPLPFNPIQILWVNIIMDGPPAMALGVDAPRAEVMDEAPRDPRARILNLRRLGNLTAYGATMAVGTLGLLHYGLQTGEPGRALTLAFTAFVLFQVFNVFNARADARTAFTRDFFTNGKLWLALGVVVGLQVLAVHWAPVQAVFRTTALSAADWLLATVVAASVLVLEELRKLAARIFGRRPSAPGKREAAEAPEAFPWHAARPEEVLERLVTGSCGLSEAEALRRLEAHGPNRLTPPKRRGPMLRLLSQFHNVLIYILLGAAAVTAWLGHWVDTAVILGVVLINAIIGFIQEGKAERALEAIRELLSPQATCLRDGVRVVLPAEGLVPGDLVVLRSGDKVPADLRLLRIKNLHVDEATLTGESLPVAKSVEPLAAETAVADRLGMAYAGTLVTYGQGMGVVVATGEGTEIGRISAMLGRIETLTTPLLQQMAVFGRWLTVAILGVAAVTFAFGVLVRAYSASEMFMAAVGLAVAAIPEGLPAIMTITLALGVQRMARRNAIIRRLPGVETLGSVTVICSDKTGTLTRNEMTVQSVATAEHCFEVSGVGYDPHGAFSLEGSVQAADGYPELMEMGRAALLCNEAALYATEAGWQLRGDPTEGALLAFAMKAGLDPRLEREEFPRTDLIPFESEHRFMATLHHDHAGHTFIYVKGAPEEVLERCSYERSGGEDRTLNPAYWHQRIEAVARAGQRLLAIAFKAAEPEQRALRFQDVEGGLSLLGLVGMADAPRAEAIAAVRRCQSAGIRVKMITGDHALTARAIGAQLGIGGASAEVYAEPAKEGRRVVLDLDRFAAAPPEDKLRLVRLLLTLSDSPRGEGLAAFREYQSAGARLGPESKASAPGMGEPRGDALAVLTGTEIDALTDEALGAVVLDKDIYARASPEHKLRLVQALQARGQVVAMTGDGVNDAPALRRADIGVAMGQKGMEVAKEAAEMVLADDNFATIAHAVEEGRTVYDNLKKSILFILPTNGAEALMLISAIALGETLPITPVQILWINMITAVTLALALAFEPQESHVMARPPRRRGEPLLSGQLLWRIGLVSAVVVMGSFGLFLWAQGEGLSLDYSRTLAVNALVMFEAFYLLNTRYLHAPVLSRAGLFGNRYVLAAILLVTVFQLLYTYAPPMQRLFASAPLAAAHWLTIVLVASSVFFLVELEKALLGRWRAAKSKEKAGARLGLATYP